MAKIEKTLCNELPFRIYTYDNKIFYLEKTGSTQATGFDSLDAAVESMKYQAN